MYGYTTAGGESSDPAPAAGTTPAPAADAPAAPAASAGPPAAVTHVITFWANGFTVNDGPLRQYDDPANTAFMQAVGRVGVHA